MWVPSFFSVLGDLWRFLWRLDQRVTTAVTTSSSHPVRPALQQLPQRKPILVQESAGATLVELVHGQTYTDESVATLSVRRVLQSDGIVTKLAGNLRLSEWLAYTMIKHNSNISALPLLMTPIGRWHQTLKGMSGVQVSIEPATGSVVEYTTEDNQGHAGLVLSVTPTGDIKVGSISQNPDGRYTEQVYTSAQSKEQGMVFIKLRV